MSDSPIAAVFTHEGGTVAAAWFGSPPPEPEPGICALTGAWSEQTWPRDIIVSSNFTRGDWLGRPDSDRFSDVAVCAFRPWGPIRVACSRWNPRHYDRAASIITPNGVTDIPRGAGYPDTLPEVSVLIMPLTRQQHVLPQRGVVWGTYVTEQGVVPQRPVTHQALLRFRTLRAAVMRGIRPRQHDRHVESIPLRKIVPGKAHRSRWFWAASCGIVPDDVPVESRWFGRRTDTTGERARTGKVRNVNASTGADKAVWRARRIVLPGVVAWRAVGDQDEVARWLGEVTHIGDDVRAGNGRVARWEVIRQREEGRDTPITQIEAARWVLGIDPDDTLKFGRLLRPVRPQLGPLFGVEGHETVPGTHRPPYIHPTRTSVGRRDWLDVLAPKPADR